MLEEILDRRNIEKALVQVEANKGAGGTDGMPWDKLRPYINANWQYLRQSVLESTYEPGPVRKVAIDKPQGGKRMLGIPTVADRLFQQAIAQWLTLMYEPFF